MFETVTFYTLGGLVLLFALLVVSTRNTVHAILFLVIDFLAVALLYASMNSMFVAAIQVLVYAGGIVVLYLFVVMLVNHKRPPEEHADPNRRNWVGAAMTAAVLGELVVIGVYASLRPAAVSASTTTIGYVEETAMVLYTDYLIPFEVASVLLLVAMIGAIVLARREL